jgi:hypothetical protein
VGRRTDHGWNLAATECLCATWGNIVDRSQIVAGQTRQCPILSVDLDPRPRKNLPVGAEQVIHSSDLQHRWRMVVGHDRRPWRYDFSI